MKEQWIDIEGYEGLYQVSNLGRVKSLNYKRTGKEKILKPANDGHGYQQVRLNKDGIKKNFLIHRLVALAFLENLDPNATDVNHKDENKANNVVVLNDDGYVNVEHTNLEWCTRKYNINYGTRTERTSKRVLQFTKDGVFVREWVSTMEVQRVLGINQGNISQCCIGKRNSSSGFKWQYA